MSAIFKLALGLALALLLAVTTQAQQACEAIAEQARRYKPPADGTFLFPVQGLDKMPDSVVHLGRKQDTGPPAIEALRTKFRLDAPITFDDSGNVLWELGHGLHALQTQGGTAHCSAFLFFAADPKRPATIVDPPPAVRGPRESPMRLCSGAGSQGLVGTVGGEPAFFVQEGMDQDFEIGVSLWRNRAWQPECKLSLHFSAAFSIGERFCSGVDCEAAASAALSLAKRIDKNPKLQEQEEVKLSAPEREAFRKMLPHRPEGLPPFAERTLPTFGNKTEFHDFGCGESLLPVKIDGQLYLGRLGHGSIGWRCYNDFVFALYAPKDDGLEPVAGITIDKVRAAPVEPTVK